MTLLCKAKDLSRRFAELRAKIEEELDDSTESYILKRHL